MDRRAWAAFREHPLFWIGQGVPYSVALVLYYLAGPFRPGSDSASLSWLVVASALLLLTSPILRLPLLVSSVRAFTPGHGTLRLGASSIVSVWATAVLVDLGTLVGTVLFVVPGVLWSARTITAPFFALAEGLGPVEAIRRAAARPEGRGWEGVEFVVWYGVVVGVGLLAAVVGVAVTFPIGTLMLAARWATMALPASESAPELRSAAPSKPLTAGTFLVRVWLPIAALVAVVGLFSWFIGDGATAGRAAMFFVALMIGGLWTFAGTSSRRRSTRREPTGPSDR